ncbi:MAG TPA: peptidoglycan DD-metalloendopeptidase family protein [Burkholderiales bacterium]|nr:peptidoglycan DD-metalloendopeptidase family protein [Burkholderiales bacterium]
MSGGLRKRLGAHVAGVVLALACVAATAGPKDELKDVRDRIDAIKKKLTESESSKAEAADALKDSERAVSETSRKIYQLSGQRREVNSTVSRLQSRIQSLEASISEEQSALGKLLYQQYVGGQSDAVKLVLTGEDPNEIARQLHYLSYVSRARAEILANLRENLADLEKLTDENRRKGSELRALQNEETRQMRKLEKQKADRHEVYVKVSDDIEKNRRQLSTLTRDEERLTQLIDRLAKEAARKSKSRKPGKKLANKALPGADSGSGPFRQLKGRLRLPVIGELTNRFGSPRQDSGLSWKGLFISARPGKEVKAVAGGRVVYADWLRGFGNLLILDHGDGYMSLYGNNESLLKQVGDETRAGDTIAATGNSGGNPDSGLYFELRFQGKPFDPIPWVTFK